MKSIIAQPLEATQTLWWITRLSILGSALLLLSNIATISVIYSFIPLKEIRPYLVSIHPKSEQVVTLEPLEKTQSGFGTLMEALARQYVLLREPIDFQTEEKRWKELFWNSTPALFDSFECLMKKENQDSPMYQFYERNIIRSVKVLSSQHLGPNVPNVWQAQDSERLTGKIVQIQIFVSTITAESKSRKVAFNDQFINPIGFTVTAYHVSPKIRIEK